MQDMENPKLEYPEPALEELRRQLESLFAEATKRAGLIELMETDIGF
jgi:hypothetical protein